MKKFVVILMLTLLLPFKIQASGFGGGDALDFETLNRVCIEEPDSSYMSQCNALGFNYETIKTKVNLSSHGDVEFETFVVKTQTKTIRTYHSSLIINCNSCSGALTNSKISNIVSDIEMSFKLAASSSSFTTQIVTFNGRSQNRRSQQTNGSNISTSLKDWADAVMAWADVWDRFIGDEKEKFDLLKDTNGKVIGIIKFDEDSNVLVVDLNRDSTVGSNGSIEFEAEIGGLGYGESYSETIERFEQHQNLNCDTVYTGTADRMVAQTVCW